MESRGPARPNGEPHVWDERRRPRPPPGFGRSALTRAGPAQTTCTVSIDARITSDEPGLEPHAPQRGRSPVCDCLGRTTHSRNSVSVGARSGPEPWVEGQPESSRSPAHRDLPPRWPFANERGRPTPRRSHPSRTDRHHDGARRPREPHADRDRHGSMLRPHCRAPRGTRRHRGDVPARRSLPGLWQRRRRHRLARRLPRPPLLPPLARCRARLRLRRPHCPPPPARRSTSPSPTATLSSGTPPEPGVHPPNNACRFERQ